MRKHIKNLPFSLLCLAVMMLPQACEPSLDYVNTNAINPDNVWNDEKLISAFLTDIHGSSIPSWPGERQQQR